MSAVLDKGGGIYDIYARDYTKDYSKQTDLVVIGNHW